jgi:spore maturation protein CgeB
LKFLLIGNDTGWMGLHLAQFSAGFNRIGHEAMVCDYGKLESNWFSLCYSADVKNELRHRQLKKVIAEFKPDIAFFIIANLKFNFSKIREYYKGKIAVYDMDGPGWKCYEKLEWIKEIDILFTASKISLRDLRKQQFDAVYLADGVDVDYYSPINLSQDEIKYYGSAISFVGRPTPRRVHMLREIADLGLSVWGRRWSRQNECNDPVLWRCNRVKKDIIGKNVVKIYNASGLSVNILREPLNDPPTIMSLQVFIVPASGACLLTEWVEELDEMFEPGKELLTFRNEDEFKELAMKYTRDVVTARQIGMAGRKRCMAEHTHEKRAEYIIKSIFQ